jgi:hypothetical protein
VEKPTKVKGKMEEKMNKNQENILDKEWQLC